MTMDFGFPNIVGRGQEMLKGAYQAAKQLVGLDTKPEIPREPVLNVSAESCRAVPAGGYTFYQLSGITLGSQSFKGVLIPVVSGAIAARLVLKGPDGRYLNLVLNAAELKVFMEAKGNAGLKISALLNANRSRQIPLDWVSPAILFANYGDTLCENYLQGWPPDMQSGLSVQRMKGNGDRPVAVYRPQGFDPKRPFTVVTYFHGHGFDIGASMQAQGLCDRVRQMGKTDPQIIFIFPQGREVPFEGWMEPGRGESYAGMERKVLAELGIKAQDRKLIQRREVFAFSGGGIALSNMLKNSGALEERRFDRVVLLDAVFHDWPEEILKYASRQQKERGQNIAVEAYYTQYPKTIGLDSDPLIAAMEKMASSSGFTNFKARAVGGPTFYDHCAVAANYFGLPSLRYPGLAMGGASSPARSL